MDLMHKMDQEINPELARHSASFIDENELDTLDALRDINLFLFKKLNDLYLRPDAELRIHHLALNVRSAVSPDIENCFASGMNCINALLDQGTATLNLLLKPAADTDRDTLHKNSRLRGSSMSLLTKMAAAHLFKLLGDHVLSERLDPPSLKSYIKNQFPPLGPAKPENLNKENAATTIYTQSIMPDIDKLTGTMSKTYMSFAILKWILLAFLLLFILSFLGIRACTTG